MSALSYNNMSAVPSAVLTTLPCTLPVCGREPTWWCLAFNGALLPWPCSHDAPEPEAFVDVVDHMCPKAQHGVNAIGSRLVCEFDISMVCKLALPWPATPDCLPETSAGFPRQSAALPPSATYGVTCRSLREPEPLRAPCQPAEAHQHLSGNLVAQVIMGGMAWHLHLSAVSACITQGHNCLY